MCIIPGGKALQLNRAGMRTCDAVTPLDTDTTPVQGWKIDYIRADESPMIDVAVGPTGGKKGYQGITGDSRGSNQYINKHVNICCAAGCISMYLLIFGQSHP